jgi:hypothetical protein
LNFAYAVPISHVRVWNNDYFSGCTYAVELIGT